MNPADAAAAVPVPNHDDVADRLRALVEASLPAVKCAVDSYRRGRFGHLPAVVLVLHETDKTLYPFVAPEGSACITYARELGVRVEVWTRFSFVVGARAGQELPTQFVDSIERSNKPLDLLAMAWEVAGLVPVETVGGFTQKGGVS